MHVPQPLSDVKNEVLGSLLRELEIPRRIVALSLGLRFVLLRNSPLLYSYVTLPIRETSQAEGYQQTSSEASRENIAPLRRSLPV